MQTHTAQFPPYPQAVTYRESTLGYVAHCKGCGTYYTPETWQELPLVGVQDLGDGEACELRNCQCLARAGKRGAYTLGAELEVLP